jgi:hypothetical protein
VIICGHPVYPIPIHLKPAFDKEVDKLFDLKIIRPSNSPFSSPVVMVIQSDNTYRLTVDFRQLNAHTIFRAEPCGSLEEDLYKFAKAKKKSELDITKAYYQIKLSEKTCKLTAFPTNKGLMEFTRMPFGMVTAGATYITLMRIVLAGLKNVAFYYDNIFIYTITWDEHVKAIETVLERLELHGLTARPSKCKFAFKTLNYLGFTISEDKLATQPKKIDAILKIERPTTKKTLRSFLGVISFYRRFIKEVATLTAPLSDLLKKGTKEPLQWTTSHESSFENLKQKLVKAPVLKLPDKNKTFILRTDASNIGLGAILLQFHDDTPFPISYASRKLLPREKNYSTVERECLAIIFGIAKFKYYLFGK